MNIPLGNVSMWQMLKSSFGFNKYKALTRTGPKRNISTDLIPFGPSNAFGTGGGISSSAVWACVHKISSRVGSARFYVVRYRRESGCWEEQPNHTLNSVLRSPSPRISPYVFWRTIAEHVLVNGNGYAIVGERNMQGYPLYLILADTNQVNIATHSNGDVVYRLGVNSPGGPSTQFERLAHNVAHVKGPHYVLSTGKSISPVHSAAKESICLQENAMKTATLAMENATRFSGVFETAVEGVDNEETDAYFEKLSETSKGEGKGGAPVLPYGVTYKAIQGLQRDMQLAGDLNWTVQDIARVYGVPLAMIQSTGGQRPDIEQLEDGLLRDAVWPILNAITDALTISCIPVERRQEGFAVRAHVMAGGPTQSGQASMAMTMGQTGAVSINEVRSVLGLPPIEGGERMPQTAGAGEREQPGQQSEGDMSDE